MVSAEGLLPSRERGKAAGLDVNGGAIQPEKLVGVNDFRREEAKGRGLSAQRGQRAPLMGHTARAWLV